MIPVVEGIWIGTSTDGDVRSIKGMEIEAVLNVARDLKGKEGWPVVEYAQVGLVDGPGNTLCAYSCAVLALRTLLDRHEKVLVYCHDGNRAMVVIMMYLAIKRGMRKEGIHPTFLSCWSTWDRMLTELRSQVGYMLPEPCKAHREAYDKMPFSLLENMMGN